MGRNGRGVAAASESSIQITFQYKGQRCRERIKLKPTAANLKRAEHHRSAILVAIETGTFDYAATFPNSPNAEKFAETLGQITPTEQYLEKWLKRQKNILKASTYDGYRKIIDYQLIPKFKDVKLADIKRKDIRDWLDSLECGNKRLANIQSVLRKALSDAVDDDVLYENPLANWTYRKNEAPKNEDVIDPFTPEEQQIILNKCKPAMRNQVLFSLWTGIRPSELVALTWNDIDWHRGVIIINKAITQAAKGKVETTKTTSGIREIKILDPVKKALNAQKKITYMKGERVFVHPVTFEPWSGAQEIRRYWVTLLKQAQVRYRRPYQTRHTYASMMLSAGEHPMWVAKQMGHSDWAMIIRVYGKWMPAADLEAGSRAERIFKIAI